MSYKLRSILDEDNNKDKNSIVTYQRRDTHFGAIVQCTSSVVVNIRQLQIDLQTQHQHDKDALTELNQRLHLLVDRIQSLQSQNSKYLVAIGDIRRQFSGINITDVQWEENYFSSQSNLSTVSIAKIDYEWDSEMYQLYIGIYQQLIGTEQPLKDKRILMLEDELKQSASVLITLRTSYGALQREVENLHAENEDFLKQYLTLTRDWCNMKKQQKKWDLNMEILKNSIVFYKNLRSYSTRDYDSLSIHSDDMTQFWTLELDKVIKSIRRDFEGFYATLYREMTVYYEAKTEESEINIKQALHYQQTEMEQFAISQQKLQIEYEKVQKNFNYEREILMKLETTYSKLEAEYKSIQLQHEERFEIQSNDLESVQESIMTMAYDVDEIRRNKASLEVEIIIYRQLLESSGIEVPMGIVPRTQIIESGGMTRKLAIKKQKKGPIGIKECAPNGTYISLVNYSTNKNIDISGWVLTRQIDSKTKYRYAIPDGVRLEQGNELRIYTKLHGGALPVESTLYHKLVNNNLVSWGEGETIETYLFNQNGDEEASYMQSIGSSRI